MARNIEGLGKKVPLLRDKFASTYASQISKGVYDARDLERLNQADIYAECFLQHEKGDLNAAVQLVDISLKWRKEMGLNDLTEKSFPRDIHELGAVFYRNRDVHGVKILYFDIKRNKKDPERNRLVKQFIGWWMDKHYLKNPGERIVALLDMAETGFSNIDMDLIKFQVYCFTTYYPALLDYMLIYEMPWVLNAIWKVIKTLLSAEQQKAVIFVKKNEIQKFIKPEQLFSHMGGKDSYKYSYIPSEDSGIEIENEEVLTPEEEPEEQAMFDISIRSDTSGPRKRVTFAEKDQMTNASLETDRPPQPNSRPNLLKHINNSNSVEIKTTTNVCQPPTCPAKPTCDTEETTAGIYKDFLLSINPGEEMDFSPTDTTKEVLSTLKFVNESTYKRVAFKVKTTSPEKYRVRPSTGVVSPRCKAEVQVFLQPGHIDPTVSKDKFLVMYMEVDENVSVPQVTDLFKSTPRENYREHRLKCKLSRPSADYADVNALKEEVSKLQDQMDKIVADSAKMQYRMGQVYKMQVIIATVFFAFAIAMAVGYAAGYLPINKYTVNTCMPYRFN